MSNSNETIDDATKKLITKIGDIETSLKANGIKKSSFLERADIHPGSWRNWSSGSGNPTFRKLAAAENTLVAMIKEKSLS